MASNLLFLLPVIICLSEGNYRKLDEDKIAKVLNILASLVHYKN